MTAPLLLDAIADDARRIAALSRDMGRHVSIDPEMLLQRDIALQPPGLWSPNRHCRLVQARDGWMAVNLARQDDLASVAAWLECDDADAPWDAVIGLVKERATADLLERSILLGMPVSVVGEAPLAQASELHPATRPERALKVLDLSALWAGPLCGALLADAGLEVTKVQDPARPDPTAVATPVHHQRLNGRKSHVSMTLASSAVGAALDRCDVLITSARPHALARLGLTPDAVFDRHPQLIWVAITAHGFIGDNAMRVGFGDDTAAAGGLISRVDGAPSFLGDALADPLTGLRAAHLALRAIVEARAGLIDVALASSAADFARRAGLR
jgi:hypothetical protein